MDDDGDYFPPSSQGSQLVLQFLDIYQPTPDDNDGRNNDSKTDTPNDADADDNDVDDDDDCLPQQDKQLIWYDEYAYFSLAKILWILQNILLSG